MRKIIFIISFSLIATQALAQDSKVLKEKLKNEEGKISYYLGTQIGSSLKQIEKKINFDRELFFRGFNDSISDKELLLSQEELANAQKDFIKQSNLRQNNQNTDVKKQAEKNKKEGQSFLSENKKLKGIITTKSGLQYKMIKEGEGPKPKFTDKVKVHYSGKLINGTEFDSSYKRNQPAVFPLNRVIPGWTEGLQLMKVGSKYKFFIPSHLAYGERGAGAQIGPHSTLIFDVELLEIVK